MDTNTAYVIIIFGILAAVVVLRIMDSRNKFEEDSSRREILELFKQGFRDGINSSGETVDLTLRRIGYTYPEQLDKLVGANEEADIPEEQTDEPSYVPIHEIDFDLEEFDRENEAQWATQVQLPPEEN